VQTVRRPRKKGAVRSVMISSPQADNSSSPRARRLRVAKNREAGMVLEIGIGIACPMRRDVLC